MIQPDYQRGPVTLFCADCLDVLPQLEPGSVVVTDPPYGMNTNTDWSRFSGGNRDSVMKRGSGRDYGTPITGDDAPFDPTMWVDFDRVVLWGSNHFAQRLPVGTTLVWIKRFDDAFGSFLSDAEIAWMKGGVGVYCRRDTSNNIHPENRLHPTQKPIGLMAWCLDKAKAKEGELVLDPFMGSGTTGVACIRTGRRFVGIEIDRRYFDLAVQRIDRELDQLRLPGM